MYIFGGETLRSFAFAMVVGLVLGAYSSIAIAAPAYALWKGREPEWRAAEEKYGERAAAKALSSATSSDPSGAAASPSAAPQKRKAKKNKVV